MIKRMLQHLRVRNLVLFIIGLPMVLSAVYLFVLAQERFVSESVVAVKQSGEQIPSMEGLGAIFATSGGGTRSDTLMLKAYIESADMLRLVDQQLGLRQAFAAPARDLFFRLSPHASKDQFLAYYRDRVELLLDDASGLLTVRTQGFTPEQARALNQALVTGSERFINEISQRMARDQMAFANHELEKARANLQDVKARLFAFQEKNKMLDPMVQAQANTGMTLELQARLSRMEVELKGYLAFMDENSHQVKALRQQIQATREQLEAEASRGTSETKGNARLNALAADFRALQMELHFAEEAFKAATVSLQTARVDSTRKLKTLVLVESPTTPEDAEYPKRGYNLLSLFLGFGLIFGIARLLVATVEDHVD